MALETGYSPCQRCQRLSKPQRLCIQMMPAKCASRHVLRQTAKYGPQDAQSTHGIRVNAAQPDNSVGIPPTFGGHTTNAGIATSLSRPPCESAAQQLDAVDVAS